MSASFRRVGAALAALALAAFCLAAAPRQGKLVVKNLAFGVEHISDPLPVARRVIYGPRFMRGIDAIAAVIPPDGSYWLVDGNENKAEGYFVRGALAPRRARYLGRASSLDADALQRVLSEKPPAFVVLAWQPDAPPALVPPGRFLKVPSAP
ncbi:MAG TPA: hypothetical protein VLJ18_00370 [Thermoanaerobaculia bacterium]|nr:hypothetical protein [Thermoanaerobaculia bacterium]